MSTICRARVYNVVFLIVAFSILVFAMFPGRFDGDSIGQYQQGLAFGFDDHHSVMNAALLGVLSDIAKGPGPMFVLQLVLLGVGLFIFTDVLIASGHPTVGQAISILALIPLLSFDYFDVQKDALFTSLLAVLVGIGTRILLRRSAVILIDAFTAFCFLIFALDTRQNGFFALVPLWFLVWPIHRLKTRAILASIGAGLVVFAAATYGVWWIDDTVLNTHRSHAIYALIIFDLAGISARTGQDASGGLLPDFPANVAKCYTPHEWDAFLGGACRPVGLAAQQIMVNGRTRAELMLQWEKEILLHPIAYLRHRAHNFGCLIRLGCHHVSDMSSGWATRPWDDPNMRVTVAARAIGAMGWGMWRSPLGSGVLWILVLLTQLGISVRRLRQSGFEPMPYLAFILASASLCYTLSFAIAGVGDQLRYLHPVFFLAIVGAPLALSLLWPRSARSGGYLLNEILKLPEVAGRENGGATKRYGAGAREQPGGSGTLPSVPETADDRLGV
ncbi:MAG TPA: hypothetical protein VIG49_03195 [Acetobacteraceae bacterium]